MNPHSTHIHGADPQVNAAANAADRANKPMGLLVVAIAGAVAMGAWLLVALVNMNVASTDYDRERVRQVSVVNDINRILEMESQSPTLTAVYGNSASALLMPNHLRTVARQVWGLDEDDALGSIVTIPQATTGPSTTVSGLQRVDVVVQLQSQPIETILEFIDAALEFAHLQAAFVNELDLTPRPTGWGARIAFRRYTAER